MSLLRDQRIRRTVAATLACVVLSGCATVTLTQQGERTISSHPTYEKREAFFLWGLVGDHWIDVRKVCGTQNVQQMQTQFTFLDELFTFITLGIYAPRTAKVWCR
ncbi:MAG: Bor family protein [Candidatus Omnitrophica bacterium]|nr:Bor family protein [Candidatus Omnitrophota bacterium]